MAKAGSKKGGGPGSSNKTYKSPVEGNGKTGPNSPLRMKIKIDTISITLDVSHNEKAHIADRMDEMIQKAQTLKPKETPTGPITKGSRQLYYKGVVIHPQRTDGTYAKTGLLIQAEPWYKANAFLRFQWHPSKLGLAGFERIRKEHMQYVLHEWQERLISEGTVTRIDMAIDYLGVTPDDFIANVDQMKGRGLYTGADKRRSTESIYFGKTKSSQVCVYDVGRLARLKKETAPKGQRTRFEWRYGQGVKASALANLPNHKKLGKLWSRVTVYQPDPTAYPGVRSNYELFQNACQTRGYSRALEMLSDQDRGQVEAYMEAGVAPWWKANENWEHWDRALRQAGLSDDLKPLPPVSGVPKPQSP